MCWIFWKECHIQFIPILRILKIVRDYSQAFRWRKTCMVMKTMPKIMWQRIFLFLRLFHGFSCNSYQGHYPRLDVRSFQDSCNKCIKADLSSRLSHWDLYIKAVHVLNIVIMLMGILHWNWFCLQPAILYYKLCASPKSHSGAGGYWQAWSLPASIYHH